jgi:hypothetical protein
MLAQVTEQPRENRPQRDYYEHRVDGFSGAKPYGFQA